SPPLSESGARAEEGPKAGSSSQEGEPPSPESGSPVRQEASACTSAANRFPSQDRPTLVAQYDVIYVEAIQTANLSRRPAPVPDGNGGYAHNGASRKAGLNKSIQDGRHFLSLLAYKAACAGKRVAAVSPADTTQNCSGRGEKMPKDLSMRIHVC